MPEPPVKPFGLTQVYAPPRGTTPTVDIVLVHGLNGSPKDSWTSKSGCFWPVHLLPEFLDSARVLTYGYNANVTAFTDGASRDSIVSHAETLASSLAANRNVCTSIRYPNYSSFPSPNCSPTNSLEIIIVTKLLRPPYYIRLPLPRRAGRQTSLDL